jgi:hypothetical protein
VRVDIGLLAENPLIPSSVGVTGVVYDVASGVAEVVERRAPLRRPGQAPRPREVLRPPGSCPPPR